MNYNEKDKIPEIELRAAPESDNGVKQVEKVIKRIRLKPVHGKKAPSQAVPQTASEESDFPSEEIPIEFSTDMDDSEARNSSPRPTQVTAEANDGKVDEVHEKNPEENQTPVSSSHVFTSLCGG